MSRKDRKRWVVAILLIFSLTLVAWPLVFSPAEDVDQIEPVNIEPINVE